MLFIAHNTTDKPMTAQAVPSISPSKAAAYFHKTECFCFTQQVLQPGERIEMPVRFIVDRDLPPDVHHLTLAYTLFDITARKPRSPRPAADAPTRRTTTMASHEQYYVPAQSKWPIIATIGMLVTVYGLGTWFNDLAARPDSNGPLIFFVGALCLAYMLFGWFGAVIKESRGGLYSPQMDRRSAGA